MSIFLGELFSLDGRIALVAGGSSGIGRHMAATLARAGGDVVLVGRREAQLMGAVEAINAENEGRATAVVGNLLERDEIFRIAEEAAIFLVRQISLLMLRVQTCVSLQRMFHGILGAAHWI